MAKRFTDTTKYKKPFIRGLQGPYKLLWDYLTLDCDHAGIWIVDFEIAQVYLGSDMPVNKSDALKYFNSDEERIIVFDNEKKWFIPSFIEFQYGHLSESNRAHTNVISVLKKHGLLTNDLKLILKNKPLTSPLQGDKEKEQVKEQEKEKEQEQETVFEKKSLIYQMQSVWKTTFPHYTSDKQFDYPSLQKIAKFIFDQAHVVNGFGDTSKEIQCLNTFQLLADQVNRESFWSDKPLKSIAGNIQEFYNKIKNPDSGKKQVNGRKPGPTDHSIKDALAKKLNGK